MSKQDKAREAFGISDQELEAVFAGTNFGNAKPREIVAETILQIAGDYSTGHTALVCCQELGLVGRNKQKPRLTKKGRRYLYKSQIAYQAATNANKDKLREVRDIVEKIKQSCGAEMDYGSGNSTIQQGYIQSGIAIAILTDMIEGE